MAVTVLFGLYCIEAGIFFVVAPWTGFWALNPLLHHTAAIASLADSPFFRGFISGVGVVHFLIGIRELARAVGSKQQPGMKD